MGSSGILSRNFPTVDDALFQDGMFTSYKTIDLTGSSYQTSDKLFQKLDSYLEKLANWKGQDRPWGGRRIDPETIEQKVLHLGIPNGSVTAEQIKAFEQLGKRAKQLQIPIKVTAIE